MKTFLITIVIFFLGFANTVAQHHIVHGVIHTLDSIPLEGVEIQVKSSKNKIFSDSLGKFVALCNESDKLIIKAKGFYNQNVKISDKIKLVAINLKMKPGEKQREYAIGYGNISAEELSAAILSSSENEMNYNRFSNMLDLISSMGAQVQNGEIVLRGSRSFQGSSGALIVIDGVISDYSYLNSLKPIEIAKIDILRDGASSVYGSRGANGAVIIETKKGK